MFDELGYANSLGLDESPEWESGRPIPDINSAYVVRGSRVLYFATLDHPDPDRLLDLYRSVWTESQVPLLYVILPTEIRIYNSYALPPEHAEELSLGNRLLEQLTQLTNILEARQAIRSRLRPYGRMNLDTGAFWATDEGRKVNADDRADQRLQKSIAQLRRVLVDKLKLPNTIAYALLGRSLLIRYLEDRDIITSEQVTSMTDAMTRTYRDSLNDLATAYRLSSELEERFHGDIFPVEAGERQAVGQHHLQAVADFLDGTDLESGQTSFWPYNFRFIPIALMSSVYDIFLADNKRRGSGTYYTPLSLVDFMLNETLPLDAIELNMRILDPACGSGIFLVRAYERLIATWRRLHRRRPTFNDLGEILKRCIFGVDKYREAIQVAAFNLYLVMLDHMDDRQIATGAIRFPHLQDSNLLVEDFFATATWRTLGKQQFDRVVGNLPWGENTLTKPAADWLQANGLSVGDKQIAQAFLYYAPKFCKKTGEVAMLAPARGTVTVGSEHAAFRQQFFQQFRIRAVVNFSALVYELFTTSISPTVALFYRAATPAEQEAPWRVIYGVPKPSYFSRQVGAVLLDANDIKYLERTELVAQPDLWKTAMWGTARDAQLIRRLRTFPTLAETAARRGWRIGSGLTRGGPSSKKRLAPWLEHVDEIPTDRFEPYILRTDGLRRMTDLAFTRPRTPDTVRGPLALIRLSPVHHRATAAFHPADIAYYHEIIGVGAAPGDERLLKWLVACVNSPLIQYYHFLTSSLWAVERGLILEEEYKRMPLPIPTEGDPRLQEVLWRFDQIVELLLSDEPMGRAQREASVVALENDIAELVFDVYGIDSSERDLVRDMVEYGIGFYYWSNTNPF